MLKDKQDCPYNGGGYAKPLRSWLDLLSIQYTQTDFFCETFLYTQKEKKSCLRTEKTPNNESSLEQ